MDWSGEPRPRLVVEQPYGDVVDRVTILLLKEQHLTDPGALGHVRRELTALGQAWRSAHLEPMQRLAEWEPLRAVNRELWDVEDALRDHERRGDFGLSFVSRARSVYRLNDRRARLKRAINDRLGSPLVEEKAYVDWGS